MVFRGRGFSSVFFLVPGRFCLVFPGADVLIRVFRQFPVFLTGSGFGCVPFSGTLFSFFHFPGFPRRPVCLTGGHAHHSLGRARNPDRAGFDLPVQRQNPVYRRIAAGSACYPVLCAVFHCF